MICEMSEDKLIVSEHEEDEYCGFQSPNPLISDVGKNLPCIIKF